MNTEKLELKYLAGYLPYGLKCTNGDLIGIRNHVGWMGEFKFEYGSNHIPIQAIKSILRPLSYLSKEIEVNGEKFVPIKALLDIALKNIKKEKEPEFWFDNNAVCYSVVVKTKKGCLSLSFDLTDNSFVLIMEGKTMSVPNQLELFQKLYEWHFDVHGLIEKGLAIDINTL